MAFNTLVAITAAPTLVWNAITGASEYHAQISADQKFSTLTKDVTGLATATYSPTGLTTPQKHFWRFRALLSATLYADQTNATGAGTDNALRDAAARTYLAQGFTTGSGLPIKRVALSMKKTGTPTGNIWVEIWTSSAGAPVAITGAASANVDVSTLTTSYVTYNFSFTNAIPVAVGTAYHIVLRGDFAVSGANYANWQKDAAGSYTGGAAYKGDGTPTWSTNGTPDQIFTTYYNKWAAWSPVRAFFVNTATASAYTPTANGWAFVDPDDITDFYFFAVAPNYIVEPMHMRRGQATNISGDLLTEYISARDRIEISFDSASKNANGSAYVDYAQAAELLRFYNKRKTLYLVSVTYYVQDNHERIWKVDFLETPKVVPLAPGREDLFTLTMVLQESVLT